MNYRHHHHLPGQGANWHGARLAKCTSPDPRGSFLLGAASDGVYPCLPKWVRPVALRPAPISPCFPSGPPGASCIPRVPSGPSGVSLDPPVCPLVPLVSLGSYSSIVIVQLYGWVGPILPETHTRPAWRRGVNFDLLVIFCACPMQNVPGGSVMFQMGFRTK
jgi:hypothetical protein